MQRRRLLLTLLALPLGACGDSTGAGGGRRQEPDARQPAASDSVAVSIDVAADRTPISPYIYGSNQDGGGNVWTVRRWGGNRTTGYDWENNFSNAGADWYHQSDLYLLSWQGLPASEATIPGGVSPTGRRVGGDGRRSLVTLPMAGYVAADGTGPVSEAEAAPSVRWAKVEPRKGGPLSTTPDPCDGVVYADEKVNLLVQRFGRAEAGGVRWYALDNEPGLWASTHPRIHPAIVGAAELVERSVALASAVKAVDPGAGVMGPALFGMSAYIDLAEAPDWPQCRAATAGSSTTISSACARPGAGRTRLLDALDVHWYPEARGDHRIIDAAATTARDVAARLQAPRTLWDPAYVEDSWIGQYRRQFLPHPAAPEGLRRPVLPRHPLAITEYDYGGGDVISGGLAQADVLGIFGRYGVFLATLWGLEESDVYTSAAFELYRDYDGRQGTFGDTHVRAWTADSVNTSVYAAIQGQDAGTLHAVLLNKSTDTLEIHLVVRGAAAYTRAEAWGFDAGSATLRPRSDVRRPLGKRLRYRVPPLTAVHLVLR